MPYRLWTGTNYTFKVDQSSEVPCAEPRVWPQLNADGYQVPQDITRVSLDRGSRYALVGYNDSGEKEWGFVSKKPIASYTIGKDGLVYVYVYVKNRETFFESDVSLQVIDPENLLENNVFVNHATEQLYAVCNSNITDSDNDGWGFEKGASCIVPGTNALQTGQTVSDSLSAFASTGTIYFPTKSSFQPPATIVAKISYFYDGCLCKCGRCVAGRVGRPEFLIDHAGARAVGNPAPVIANRHSYTAEVSQ